MTTIPGWAICIAAAWLLIVVLLTLWAERRWARAKAARILKEMEEKRAGG